MNLLEMQTEIGLIVQDQSLQPLLAGWINRAILKIATDYYLPPLALVNPQSLNVDTSNWLWPLPSNFHKKLFKCKHLVPNSTDMHPVHIYSHIDELEGRNHTHTGEHVREVAVAMQGGSVQGDNYYLGIHPLAVDTLELWYYQKPAVLVQPTDVSDCIPPGFEDRVIFPQVVIQNYDYIVDQIRDFDIRPMEYWRAKLARGLNGAIGEGIGLLNFYAVNYRKPRRHGGRDPIGPSRRYFRGYF